MPSRAFIDSDLDEAWAVVTTASVLMPSRAFIDSDLNVRHWRTSSTSMRLNALTGIY